MAKRHLTQYDSSGNKQEIYLNDDEVMTDGKTLGEKLNEIDEALGEAGSGSVNGVQVGEHVYTPDENGVVDLSTPMGEKANTAEVYSKTDADARYVAKVTGKGLSTNDYTDADAAAVATIPSKANDADVVKSISVNGTAQTKDGNGNVNITVQGGNAAQEVSIFFVGNSLTQDAVSYLPLVLKEVAPSLTFKLYVWYNGGATLDDILGHWENGDKAQIFSVCENATSWTNYENTKTIANILADCDFDIVCLQEYFNYKRENGYTSAAKQTFNDVIDYLRSHYSKPFKVVSFFHRPLCKDTNDQADLSIADEVFGLTYDGVRWQLENTISEGVIPSGIAAYRAMYDNTLNALGDFGYMSPDGTHAQEGLPCLMQAWVTAMWLLDRLGIPASINNAQGRVTTANYASINVPGANLGNGVVVGTSAQDADAMDVAIQAYKEGKMFENRFVSARGIPAYKVVINGASGTKTDRAVQLSASLLPTDAAMNGITWSIVSGDATVSSNGLVTYNGTSRTASVVVRASLNGSNIKAEGTISYSLAAVETPVFSPAAGTYAGSQSVAISCATAGATIYYTTDGSTPTSASSVYSSPITVASDTTIKAIAMKNGESSNVATAAYVIAIPRTVTVNVTEDSSPLEGATVKLDDNSPVSSSGGAYVFSVADGTYTLTVQKAGYVSHSESCVVSGDKTVAVALNVRDLLANALVTNPNCMTSYGSHGSLYPCILKTANPDGGSASAGGYISVLNGRCGVAIPRSAATEPIAWNTSTKTSDEAAQAAAQQAYSLIEWPLDKDTITIKMTNTNYYIRPVLTDKTQTSFDSESGWVQGGANCEITLNRTTYPSLFYVAIHMKYLSAGTTWQSVSIAELGLIVIAE